MHARIGLSSFLRSGSCVTAFVSQMVSPRTVGCVVLTTVGG